MLTIDASATRPSSRSAFGHERQLHAAGAVADRVPAQLGPLEAAVDPGVGERPRERLEVVMPAAVLVAGDERRRPVARPVPGPPQQSGEGREMHVGLRARASSPALNRAGPTTTDSIAVSRQPPPTGSSGRPPSDRSTALASTIQGQAPDHPRRTRGRARPPRACRPRAPAVPTANPAPPARRHGPRPGRPIPAGPAPCRRAGSPSSRPPRAGPDRHPPDRPSPRDRPRNRGVGGPPTGRTGPVGGLGHDGRHHQRTQVRPVTRLVDPDPAQSGSPFWRSIAIGW